MVSGVESAKLKVERATEHLGAIDRAVVATAHSGTVEIIKSRDGEATVVFRGDVPPEVSVIAGEIVYQLRSALDHLAFELVKLNPAGTALPANWERSCFFPLLFKEPSTRSYNSLDKYLPGISVPAFSFIESVQPYHTGAGVHNAMRLIAQLSNVDKHRHLNITVLKAAVHDTMTVSGSIQHDISRGGFTHNSHVQLEPPPKDATEWRRKLIPYVTFDEPTVGDGVATLEVQHVLEVCVEQVNHVVIPAFAGFMANR